MKKTFYKIAFAAVLGTSLVSCNKLLDAPVQSAMDESVIFSSPVLAEGAVAGILQSFGETNSYRGRYLVYYGINTDNEVGNSLKNTTDEKSLLANYQTNANNTQMNTDNNAWAKFYEAIERANLAIRGLRAYGNIENNAQLAQILGEVLVLRAVVYNDLVKGWGDVPARFEPLTSANTYVPRSDRDIIYKQILADLKEAENYLPWPNGNTKTQSVEKVNKAFAKGLRARIALAAGGYAQHADGVRLSRDPDLERTKMYQIAKEECLDVINSGTLRLLGFEEVFRTLCQETNLAGKESMWEIPFSEGRGRVLFDLGVKHTTTDKYTMQNKGGTNGPNPIMWYEYDKDDVRRAVSVVPYEWTNGKQVPTNLNKWYFGKYRYEWMKRVVTSTNDDGLNWMYMRYSDVVLMAAEAVNELDGPQAAATYLKMIRDRAFPTHPEKVTAYMSAATVSKEAFFNAIVDERSLEFTGEMLRKGDLIRWNLLSAKLNEAKQKLQLLENRQGRYAGYPKNVYYKTLADGESVGIYGLEAGDTDAIGATYGTSKTWKLAADNDQVAYWDAMFLRDPNLQQFWPIWQFFIEASNGQLTNSGYNF
ncbi:SusD family protein [Sphingobacterium spiritivorum ATCC 33300]|uniref:SusD family protein n=1 Tax=Sphingobacterium spiritivorum ATCC 33300 TaxID=525372 RepID=C2FSM8_SPHSI|nr:RagB/SusD family nutrient uptake outer membrane protein [Sphingobacterium spiritivorum]EEI94002.1 SusD family protein [Sphingobacterium spiritivorum ATCC 33300]QQS94295.1 RagB/SusD family nutrient uptake outer membrane protein [Sphingobacterium spiritivorum]